MSTHLFLTDEVGRFLVIGQRVRLVPIIEFQPRTVSDKCADIRVNTLHLDKMPTSRSVNGEMVSIELLPAVRQLSGDALFRYRNCRSYERDYRKQ